MKTTTIRFAGTEFNCPGDAVQNLSVSADDFAITVGGRHFSVTRDALRQLQGNGISPTTWHEVHGRLMSVPGNCE